MVQRTTTFSQPFCNPRACVVREQGFIMSTPKTPKRSSHRWGWMFAAAILLLLAAAAYSLYQALIPPRPGAFYTPPDPLPDVPLGTVLRSEPITAQVPEGAQAWRILYLSSDMHGEPIAVSGVVIAPGEAAETERPVLAWAHGTIGIEPECGISHTRQPLDGIHELERAIDAGFVVVASDYPGLGTPGVHPYLIGVAEANAVLDSVRAAQQLNVQAGNRYALWGESQGGHAALWAAQRTEAYAPELELVGAAVAAPAIDLPGVFALGIDSRLGSIVISQALYAWSHYYAEMNLDDLIDPAMRTQFDRIATTCVTTPLAFALIRNLPTPAEFLTVDPLTTEPYKSILAENVPTAPIHVPLLISHGDADTLIPIEGSKNAFAKRCLAGEDVQFVHYPGVSHPAAAESALMTIGWIEDRFAHLPTSSNC